MDLEEVQTMIDDCIKRQSKLTEWEFNFIHNIHEQDRPLTKKQAETLENIWDRIT